MNESDIFAEKKQYLSYLYGKNPGKFAIHRKYIFEFNNLLPKQFSGKEVAASFKSQLPPSPGIIELHLHKRKIAG